MCVIDPSAPGGIRMQEATFRYATNDTVVTQGANRVPLSQVVPNVQTAQNADWYVRGTPFTMTVGNVRADFITYGTAQTLSPNDVAFLGLVRGVPVYADRDEVADIMSALEAARSANAAMDLEAILRENRELRNEVDDLQTVYVPLRAVGCSFQAVQRQEQVKKGGKQ